MKVLLLASALSLLGYAGWEAGSCCQQDPTASLSPQISDAGPPVVCSGGSCAKTAPVADPADEECCEPVASAATVSAPVAGWATVKGQVVFGGVEIPKPAEEKVTSDQQVCL